MQGKDRGQTLKQQCLTLEELYKLSFPISVLFVHLSRWVTEPIMYSI